MMTSRRLLFFLSLSFIILQGFSQGSTRTRSVLEQLQRYELEYPQQKVFLHLDREEYVAGENIWLKAYLVQAGSHIPDTSSTSLNVELFDMNGQAVVLQLLRMQDGLGYGQISLPDSLPEGNYKLRSYTNWMQNFPETLFFEQDIFVHNPIEQNFIRRADLRRNQNFNKELEAKSEEIQLGLFPEGGQLVAGVENRVAFLAADGTGKPLQATGKVIDSGGQILASFQTDAAGMGLFVLAPINGQTYRAELTIPGRTSGVFPLPQVVQQAYALRVDAGDEEIAVKLHAGFDPISLNLPEDIFIIAQCGGKAYFIEEGKLVNRQFSTTFSTSRLPSGVTQVIAFDANSTPVAERLIFVNHNDHLQPDLDLSRVRVGSENGLQVGFNLDFVEGSGDWAHLSMAVEGSETPFEVPAHNILTEFLL